MSSRKNRSTSSICGAAQPTLRISEVALRVGISSSALRAWEALGLVTPHRTRSRYRLYKEDDVRLLQRAIFLRRARGLNPAAIVHILKRQGVVSVPAESAAFPGLRFRRLRQRRGLSLAQVARSTGVSVGFLSALERGQMRASIATLRRIARYYGTNILSFFETAKDNSRLMPKRRKVLKPPRACAWNSSLSNTAMEPHPSVSNPAAAAANHNYEGEEFLYILRGEFETPELNERYQ